MPIDDASLTAEPIVPGEPTTPGWMARAIDSHDWKSSTLGPREAWPPALATIVNLLLASDIPMTLYWGPDHRIIYNDAAVPGFGTRETDLGMEGAEAWGDWWQPICTQLAEVERTRRSLTLLEVPFTETDGPRIREIYWNLTFWPVIGEDGALAGVLCAGRDTTKDAFRKRLNRLLVGLDDALMGADSLETIMSAALGMIAEQLQADRVGFGEIDAGAGAITIREVWSGKDMPDIRGNYPLGSFGDIGQGLGRGETAVIDDVLSDPRTAAPEVRARNRDFNMRAGLIVPILDQGQYAGGIFAQSAVPRAWTPFEIAIAEAATQRLWTAVQQLRTTVALRESEQRYRLIFEQAEDIIFTADIDQRITDANEAGARAIGLSREDLIGRSIADFVDAEGFRQTTAMLEQKLAAGGNTRHELPVTTLDGRKLRWENNSTLIVDSDRRPVGLLSISRDVSERRAFEERRELLIHELNHRVKNTLALVQALAQQSFRNHNDSPAAQAFVTRLRTLAAAHDLLTREHWEGVTLAELVRAATAVLGPGRIIAEGSAITVTPKAAVALAMAIHELGTNAAKYGALSVEDGRVAISWKNTGDGIVLEWQEHDGPPVSVPSQRGFGVTMIERVLASDIGGSVKMDFATGGLRCTVAAPLGGNVI